MARSLAFAVIGAEHPHVLQMAGELIKRGATWLAASELDATRLDTTGFAHRPAIITATEPLLERSDIELVVCGGVPARRAGDAIAAMRRGKDALCAKPAILTYESLVRVEQAHCDTGRFFTVWYSERVASPSTLMALSLAEEGAIGRLVHIIGLGPHRLSEPTRPEWFFDKAYAGGILLDLFSHHCDQFLALSGGTASVVSARTGNQASPDHPHFEDHGVCTLRSADGLEGFFRVDWLSPDGLGAWGDVRLMLQGTTGSIEVRKVIDPAGRSGGDHLILVDQAGIRRYQPDAPHRGFFDIYLDDLRNRTERAVSQSHIFAACSLALDADRAAAAERASPSLLTTADA